MAEDRSAGEIAGFSALGLDARLVEALATLGYEEPKRKIEIAKVPTVADLRARRLELVRASLRETLLEGDLDGFRVVVETLAAEFDPMDIAVAAVRRAEE